MDRLDARWDRMRSLIAIANDIANRILIWDDITTDERGRLTTVSNLLEQAQVAMPHRRTALRAARAAGR